MHGLRSIWKTQVRCHGIASRDGSQKCHFRKITKVVFFERFARNICSQRKRKITAFSDLRHGLHIIFRALPPKKIAIPEHHHFIFFGGFCRKRRPSRAKLSANFIASQARLSPNAKRSVQRRGFAAGQSASLTRLAQFRRFAFSRSKRIKLVPDSGAPHFEAQNGSSSFRSPAFSR